MFWTYFESYASSVIRKGATVVLLHAIPSRIINFVSYFIHTLWAYPSVIQLKKLTLLTFSFYTSFGRRLTSPVPTTKRAYSAFHPQALTGAVPGISEDCLFTRFMDNWKLSWCKPSWPTGSAVPLRVLKKNYVIKCGYDDAFTKDTF